MLIDARLTLGLSVMEVTVRTGISHQRLTSWEQRRVLPKPGEAGEAIRALAGVLALDAEKLDRQLREERRQRPRLRKVRSILAPQWAKDFHRANAIKDGRTYERLASWWGLSVPQAQARCNGLRWRGFLTHDDQIQGQKPKIPSWEKSLLFIDFS